MNKNKLSCDYIIVYSNPGNTQYINIMDNTGMLRVLRFRIA